MILEPRLVDYFRANHLGIADLDCVLDFFGEVALRRESKQSNAIIGFSIAEVLIASGQRVIRGERPIEPRAEVRSLPRVGNGLDQRGLRQRWVEDEGIDRCKFVDVAAFEVEEKRSLLAQRAANVSIVLSGIIGRLRSCERIPRTKSRIIAQHKELPVIFIRSGLGEDFDAAITESVVLRRE